MSFQGLNINIDYQATKKISNQYHYIKSILNLHNLDQSIYDWEKAYEISSDEKFTMHMPIDMNGNDILKTSHYLHGYLITNLSDKTFIINGGKRVLLLVAQ